MAETIGTLTLLVALAFIAGASLVFLYLVMVIVVMLREAVKVGRQMRGSG